MVSISSVVQMPPRQRLRHKLEFFFDHEIHQLPPAAKAKIIRIQVDIDRLDPLGWLSQQTAEIKTYWSDREGRFDMAGVGATDILHSQSTPDFSTVFSHMQQRLPANASVRYYGGFSFQPGSSLAQQWQEFGTYRFVVPQFEVYAAAGKTYLACNFLLSEDLPYPQQLAALLNQLNQLSFTPEKPSLRLPKVINRQDFPSQWGWQTMLKKALNTLQKDILAKIVLARRSDFLFSQKVEPLSLLMAIQQGHTRLFRFCFQPQAGKAFIGASPERLYHRLGCLLQTEAIAGTRPRGQFLADDQSLGQDLLTSEKDNREHQFVVHSLRESLSQLCKLVGLDQAPALLKLSQVQHLHTACNGILVDGVDDGKILSSLHPTPAVGGYPKQPAREAIEQLEPFERGWYAAPVGWVGHDNTEFAVAIRSGLVVNDQLSLFAGAGIVPGSKPRDEWQEIENKIRAFTTVLNPGQNKRRPLPIDSKIESKIV
ncbi:isochorismate synthase [Leptothoe spongobia]|uniref:Isochorismate synthase MenF n=1 Tax=Leptothoe spongobia TAU-MAC 1115 TaxID=1967444 RepID=A0A947DF85_9CYAN|nr:isochorismate synthase [Leptothoe spongobia]MBT9315815.1 isochorismate synthase [Leptothoe spongobia TAU-MAC 1115]